MRVLGIESSCDETGVALFDSDTDELLGHALHSQIDMHQAYGGVVPELASRDHIRRIVPLLQSVLEQAGTGLETINAIAYTQGPGLAGALLVGSGFAHGLGRALSIPVIGIHHLEGHLLSPLLSQSPPAFPFVALLVSGGHSQLMEVTAVGQYRLMGETLDDAAGEAFDKTAKLLGLSYPGGPALSKLAEQGNPKAYEFPRPMIHSKDFNFSFSGLKTAVLTAAQRLDLQDERVRADLAASFQAAIVDVLTTKAMAAVKRSGFRRLVIAGGVGANGPLRERLKAEATRRRIDVFFPELVWCTDNGAMIALAGALRLRAGLAQGAPAGRFSIRPRWDLETVNAGADTL